MEACMIKPEVKKKAVKPKPPPKPAQIKRHDSEILEKPAPVVPPRPKDALSTYDVSERLQKPPPELLPRPTDPPTPPPKPAQIKRHDQERLERPAAVVPLRPTDAPTPPPKPAQIKRNDSEGLEKPAPVVPPRPTDAETGDFFSGDFIKSNKPDVETPAQEKGLFSGKILKNSLKPTEAAQTDETPPSLNGDVSGNNGDLSENSKQEKGGPFSGLLRMSNKILGARTPEQATEFSDTTDSLSENKLHDGEPLTNSEALSESQTKERGGIFSGIFKKSSKPVETAERDENGSPDTELLIRNDLTENKQEKARGLFSGLFKKTLKASGQWTESLDREDEKEPSASSDELTDSNMNKEQDVNSEDLLSSSCENLKMTVVKVKKRGLAGIFKKSTSTDNLFDEESNTGDGEKSVSWENLSEAATSKVNTGRLAGIFRKSPKPAPRSIATEDVPSNTKELSTSSDSLMNTAEEDLLADNELVVGNNLSDASNPTKEKKGGFVGMFRKTAKTVEQQKSEDTEAPEKSELRHRRTIKKKKRVVSFRVKKTLPKIPKLASQTSDKMPIIEENVELGELNSTQESTVEVQPVEMAAYQTENNALESEQENDDLMEWWNTVKGWTEWNKTSDFQKEDEEMAVEQAADRVYLAARLFVRLFNLRGASLQRRILELLSLADAADQFHKKTVSAAVGGGVASVAGSVATITGLILAPFTFGASIIVTAVGISVATAGGITSATANITDTVHSRMDRKKVEKMIQGYQEEIKDIRECLDFVQEGMDTLHEWDFEQYSQSAAKKALNHSVKHVVKEGGHAGKDLMINTTTLISTVQLLGATGGAVKAAQVISITTGVMSGLFLALDVFFLAKDSHELRKGAKTEFAVKIREVCKELQGGLLELNKVKTQLQKTMDGIELEEYEEVVEIEEDLEWDPKKLAELEKELDLLEEKLDKKTEKEQKKSKEAEKENLKSKEKKEKSMNDERDAEMKEKDDSMREKNEKKDREKEKDEVEGKFKSKLEKLCDEGKEKKTKKHVKAGKEALKDQSKTESKLNKETKKQKEKCESKRDKARKDTVTNDETAEEKEMDVKEVKNRSGDSQREDRSKKLSSERTNPERDNQTRDRGRGRKPEWKPVSTEKDVERGSGHEMRESNKERGNMERLARKDSNGSENWRKTEEETAVKDRRTEVAKSREQTEIKEGSESERGLKTGDGKGDVRKESRSKRKHVEGERRRSSTEETDSRRSQDSRETAPRDDRTERGGEKQGSSVESARRQSEREEAKEGKRREDGESGRRDRRREHTQRGHRPRSSALLGDGLYI